MKKFIIPVDFSDTSKNAAIFAAKLSRDTPESQLILYHVFDKLSAGADGTPLYNDIHSRANISIAALNNLKSELQSITSAPVICIAEPGQLADNLEKIVRRNGIDLVIMGMNGSTKLEQLVIGSSTLKVVRKDSFPVIIIPPGTNYHAFQKAVFVSDLKDVESSIPIASLRRVLEIFKPELHILHIKEEKEGDLRAEKQKLDDMLEEFHPIHATVNDHDFTKGIGAYISRKAANLMITIPKRHNFLTNLFKPLHTSKLAYHSHVPILTIHE